MSDPSTKSDQANQRERRDFFRVSQDVFFDFKVVESFCAESEKPESQFEDAATLSLVNELKRLDKDNSQTLRLLTEKNRLLGDYLQALSNKIDLIARHTLFTQDSFSNEKKKTRINLSEDGMAFMAERAIYKGSYIVVRLIFLPNYAPVATFAKVIRCEAKEKRYQVAVKFFRISEIDRQELSRQILKAQTVSRKPNNNK